MLRGATRYLYPSIWLANRLNLLSIRSQIGRAHKSCRRLIDQELNVYRLPATGSHRFVTTLIAEKNFHKVRRLYVETNTIRWADVGLYYKEHFTRDCIFNCSHGSPEISQIRIFNADKTTEEFGSEMWSGYPADWPYLRIYPYTWYFHPMRFWKPYLRFPTARLTDWPLLMQGRGGQFWAVPSSHVADMALSKAQHRAHLADPEEVTHYGGIESVIRRGGTSIAGGCWSRFIGRRFGIVS